MRITIKELRRIIKEEVEGMTDDEVVAAAIGDLDVKGAVTESRNRRGLHEMDTALALGVGTAAGAAGVYAWNKWGRAALDALKQKVINWADEVYYNKSVKMDDLQIEELFQKLQNDEGVKKLKAAFVANPTPENKKAMNNQILRVMKDHGRISLSAGSVLDAHEKGEVPKGSRLAWMHQRPSASAPWDVKRPR